MIGADFLHYVIGAGQLGFLVAIFFRLGELRRGLADHIRSDDRQFSDHARRLTHLERVA